MNQSFHELAGIIDPMQPTKVIFADFFFAKPETIYFPSLCPELHFWQKSEPNSYIITKEKDRQTANLVVGGKICRRDGRHLVGEKVQENPMFLCGH